MCNASLLLETWPLLRACLGIKVCPRRSIPPVCASCSWSHPSNARFLLLVLNHTSASNPFPPSLDHHDWRLNWHTRNDGHIRPWENRIKRVNGAGALLAIKEHEILDWLLPLSQHIDDILSKLTA